MTLHHQIPLLGHDQHLAAAQHLAADGEETAAHGRAAGSSVWPVAQRSLAAQRSSRYVPGSRAHPGRMAPGLAAHAIATYTDPGDLVLDPMAGIGTTLVEAIHTGRDAHGIEYEPRWAALARANIALARTQGATGSGSITVGDARCLAGQVPDHLAGRVRLVLTSPPYGPHPHARVTSTRDSGRPGVATFHNAYGDHTDRRNLAHAGPLGFRDGLTQILVGVVPLLRADGVVVITARPWRRAGELVDLPSLIIDAAHKAGLHLADRCVALLAAEHEDRLTPRHSFLQLTNLRRARRSGSSQLLIAHEDVLVLAVALARAGGRL